MARKLKKAEGPFIPANKFFCKGKDRDIEFTLYPEYMEIRLKGLKERYHVPYGVILLRGADMEVMHKIRRGAV